MHQVGLYNSSIKPNLIHISEIRHRQNVLYACDNNDYRKYYEAISNNAKANISFKANSINKYPKLINLISSGVLTKDMAEIFIELEPLSGKIFIEKAYELIAKSMGFKEYPKLRFKKLKSDVYANSGGKGITFDLKKEIPQMEIVGVIRHELEHYKQSVEIVRAYGIRNFIDFHIMNVQILLDEIPGLCKQKFGKNYKDMMFVERIDAVNKIMNEDFPDKEYFAIIEREALRLGKCQDEEHARMLKQAYINYKSPSEIPNFKKYNSKEAAAKLKQTNPELYDKICSVVAEYRTNMLECEALDAEDAITNMYKTFKNSIIR